MALSSAGKKDGRHLVYTAKKRGIGYGHALNHLLMGNGMGFVEMSIPYDDYKELSKRRVFDNPEMGGAKNVDEFVKNGLSGKNPNPMDAMMGKRGLKNKWESLSGAKGTSGTRVFEGDIDSKYVKGGKGYKKNSIKEVVKYAKKYPKRFLKGSGKALAGLSLLGGGTVIASKGLKKKD